MNVIIKNTNKDKNKILFFLTRCARGAAIKRRRSIVTNMPNLNSTSAEFSISAYARKIITKTVTLHINLNSSS